MFLHTFQHAFQLAAGILVNLRIRQVFLEVEQTFNVHALIETLAEVAENILNATNFAGFFV